MQLVCLSLVWIFCETGPDRKFALQRGLLPLMIEAFLLEPSCFPAVDPEAISRINEEAVGCVAGCVL